MTAFSIFVLSNFLDILFYVFGHFVLPIIVLFQPFEKMYLGRSLWNIVDTLVAIFLIIDSINNKPK